CDPAGEACTDSSECCSRACVDDGTGFKACHYLGGCMPTGELCRRDAECCNFKAGSNPQNCGESDDNTGICQIFDEEEGIGRCGNPGMFAPPGELCVPNSNECCPGAGEGKLYCHVTYFGVERCLLCKLEGTDCSNDGECCGGSCVEGECAEGSCT